MGVSQGFLSVSFTISSPLQSFHNRDAFNQAAERDTVQKWREKAHKTEVRKSKHCKCLFRSREGISLKDLEISNWHVCTLGENGRGPPEGSACLPLADP